MTKYTAKLIGEFRIPAKQIAPGLTRPARLRGQVEVIPLEFFARSLEEAERLVEARLRGQRHRTHRYWTWEARGLKAKLNPARYLDIGAVFPEQLADFVYDCDCEEYTKRRNSRQWK